MNGGRFGGLLTSLFLVTLFLVDLLLLLFVEAVLEVLLFEDFLTCSVSVLLFRVTLFLDLGDPLGEYRSVGC